MFNEFEDLITIDDLCDMLNIGKNSAYNLLKDKKIKAFRIGRVWKIPKKSVEEYVQRESIDNS
ncbi:excisionase family DNA binding protein [Mobilisporobacter senegalensis]|uniref:Excisionase family DNA binding protein n=1 Tax=Mobilisporobacter senegalensis TaxID=1329262 RepID=A0A3N1XPG8_9FIRM|nr:helix-turn-helix domain-containing protein [Mobilisporobacter senegalensis]ROR28516.1 excisionase family DNA binding protein [Mobilisporobacter senegalensis]